MTENNGHFTYSGTSTTPPYTYTIKFGPNSDYYFVNFDPGLDGSGTMADQIHILDTWQSLTVNTFTRTGYVFAGWTARR